jgi:hypothetical protein
LANLTTFNPTKLAFQVADIYLEDKYPEAIAKPMPRSIFSIDLPPVELEVKTGFYHNPETGSIWELEIKDEKLMAKIAWMCFQLAPIDSTHFQSVDNEIDIDYNIEFPENSSQMIVRIDRGNRIKVYTLEKMLGFATDITADYVGTYYSAELEFSYQLYLEDNKLFVKYKGQSPFELRSIGQDLFLLESYKFEFMRKEGRVIRFDRCGDRVRRIHFSKQPVD